MLGTSACVHSSSLAGALFKCVYLFVLVTGITCLPCYPQDAQSTQIETRSLEGEVLEAQSRIRLAGVSVHIIGLEKSTHTDANGQFKLDGCAGRATNTSVHKNRLSTV